MKKITAIMFVMFVMVFSQQVGAAEELVQKEACFTRDPTQTITDCTPGQKIFFDNANSGAGGERPVMYFAAYNCDLRYQVVINNSGVTCIFMPTEFKKSKSK